MSMTYMRIYTDKADALNAMSDEALGRLVKGMLSYAMTGDSPAFGAGSPEACMWFVVKPALDADKSSYDNKCAANKTRTGSNKARSDVNRQDSTVSLTLKNQESRTKNQESRSTTPLPPVDDDLPAPNSPEAYATGNLEHLTPNQLEELGDYIEDLGGDVVRHAVDESCAAGAPRWSFCEKILRRYANEGIKSLGDAKASDDRRRASRARGDPSKMGSAQHYQQRTPGAAPQEPVVINMSEELIV